MADQSHASQSVSQEENGRSTSPVEGTEPSNLEPTCSESKVTIVSNSSDEQVENHSVSTDSPSDNIKNEVEHDESTNGESTTKEESREEHNSRHSHNHIEEPEIDVGTKPESEDDWIDILGSGDLKKLITQPGKEKNRPQRGDKVSVVVTTKLEDKTTVKEDDRFTFTLGDGEVMQGLELVVATMDVGEQAQVHVAPRFAWGSIGFENIPANSTLSLSVTVESFETEPDIEKLSVSERLSIGERKKERGNFWYGRQEYSQAVECYRKALDYLDDTTDPSEDVGDDVVNLLDHRLKVYNNMAAAQMKLKAFPAAMRSVDNVLLCQQDNVKALFRKGKILSELGRTQEAVMVLRKAEKAAPEEKSVQIELNRLTTKMTRDSQKEKSVYQRMFKSFNENRTVKQSNKNKSSWNWIVMCGVAGGIAAVTLGAVAYRFKFF